MRWIRMLRLTLGCPTKRDLEWYEVDNKARHAEMLKAVQQYMNELDRKEAMEDTLRERPSRKW